ncbi:phosphatidylinositol transfer protein beta isoform isoform X1 [Drosophila pseudoobscura]|uniref:Phosphatidylinositol transfer protein beta isoform isoform X1 n=1 Tax=Drosophila pseudoobscura pseudoobscura TaxID=46245 RepID=A0A6I8VCF6_DROPS|nr:phosphatidylinositol transfer protein beta isoform isoform X1 [Drosophila pseudoobscura]XP_015038360.1 phosphatidylinositol transfer protein beta isoform isoform X1 [Drosophila pseudoobscura]XP_015038362.1 phosphatidylinositol transfer protein beta isoform isoform X1 [Drosophila pseudoobscura]
MQIKEFRVTLPLTVEEYQVAQLFSVAEASKENTGGGEGIEVLKNEPFDNFPLLGGKYTSGQYTYKIYHLQSKVPAYIRLLAPKGSLEIHEEAWNAYPYCRTIITNPKFMKDAFKIIIDTLHVGDAGDSENNPGYMDKNFLMHIESNHFDNDLGDLPNVHELTPDKLKAREVVHIDIANDPILPADFKPEEDPTTYQSKKTGRGPLLGADWKKRVDPVMTCYKLVTCEFKWFGLQTRVENFIQKSERRLFTNFHRQVFCSTDRWYGLTMEDIRAIEEKVKEELDKARQVGEVRGMRADAD